ncbi:MAG: SWIM zinc finger family protein [Bacteroidota bacterium]|nr:SWIM zinc finger family protein [Bacteroidota bacterium]
MDKRNTKRGGDRRPHSAPRRPVRGGIRAQSQKGSFAATWWGKKWIETLESFPIAPRLERGRLYARSGQVADLRIESGTVTARVQGSRKRAYRVRISLPRWNPEKASRALERLRSQPIRAAQLLAGEMPDDIESILASFGLPLFPRRHSDFSSECSCPDWSNPCKHVAAVYYLIAEALDRDPMLLFTLRGMDRDEIIAAFQGEPASADRPESPHGVQSLPLPEEPSFFWGGDSSPFIPLPVPLRPEIAAAMPKRLGPLAFWRSRRSFLREMETVYARASSFARTVIAEENWGASEESGSPSGHEQITEESR